MFLIDNTSAMYRSKRKQKLCTITQHNETLVVARLGSHLEYLERVGILVKAYNLKTKATRWSRVITLSSQI